MSATSRRAPALSVEMLDHRVLPSGTPFPKPALGDTITGVTPHTWVADAHGLYHTATDLKAEWQGIYQRMLAGNTAGLTPIQRLEGNAEAVFENTGLKDLGKKAQARDREDAQREFDAIAAAMTLSQKQYGTDPTTRLTERSYLQLGAVLQTDLRLLELGIQGHGLNDPPASRYRGYTNDFQNNVDNSTLFIGGGLDNNEAAIPALFDDVILSHLPFPVVWQNATLTQLNQNADAEDTLRDSVVGLDDTMFDRVFRPIDFSQCPSDANDGYVSPSAAVVDASPVDLSAGPSSGVIHGLLGDVKTTVTVNGHTWTADADGRFHTASLAAEWRGYYATMLAGHAGDLTPVQRLEGNAEAVFERTSIRKASAADQQAYREDAQRQFDAMAAAMQMNQQKYGTNPADALTPLTYYQLGRTIQSDATLKELNDQGHGLNSPPSPRYDGYTNDFQNGVDGTTRYVGGGLNSGKNALTDFFDDNVLSHVGFPVVWRNGRLEQLNQNGDAENRLSQAVTALDVSMYYRVYIAWDFKK